ncbi:hypothetical protein BN159_4014 [Streptomyces davaonensis JCM 4913]|uniref:Uncharacterized protein n=1 Tax=Streptomyces davaonensis (strain DSM 101723 / JCM 4913 / KCC S-0913 / 768) TaxID=1214101 RepID=K4R4Z6_STRDJ|nr:hypothetical protein [Streptomyces davaonensis]CCK28393.1 hypothetical protein BN159_4014 [Streptomyces davaonensis JCM 4913]
MKLGASMQPPAGLAGGRRFFLVGYLPTYAAAFFLLVLFWAGARGWRPPVDGTLRFSRAWATAAALGVGEILLLVLGVTLVAVLLAPLQTSVVRLLEGAWPEWLTRARWIRGRQLRKKQAWERRTELPAVVPVPPGPSGVWTQSVPVAPEVVQRAGVAADELRRRYPLRDHLIRPTALGNALAAAEDTAGRSFGYDAVVAWPRLYAVLGEPVRAVVDDRRDTMDAAARMAVTTLVTALIAAAALARTGWWLTLALLPLAVSWVAYRGAVRAAMAYGESLNVAFDLHRFALLEALRAPVPEEPDEERRTAAAWCDLWRQGVPLPPGFRYTTPQDQGTTGGQGQP